MTKGQTQVAEFMTKFGQEVPKSPIQLDEKTAKLRAALILEEAFETITKGLGLSVRLVDSYENHSSDFTVKEGSLNCLTFDFKKEKEPDLVQLADGLGDLAYVAEFGTAVAAGIDLEPIQDEIHRSNMSKLWSGKDVETRLPVLSGSPSCVITEVGPDKFLVKRLDGKIMKSPSYSEANIAPIILSQKEGASA
jgi:hypothetical protein